LLTSKGTNPRQTTTTMTNAASLKQANIGRLTNKLVELNDRKELLEAKGDITSLLHIEKEIGGCIQFLDYFTK